MKITLRSLKHRAIAAIMGGALLIPFAATTAQAAPDFGFRGYERRNDNDRNIVVSGIVTRDLDGRDRFTVRLDNGRTAEVISRRNEPPRLSRGDRVELRGDFENNLFIADQVRITNNSGSGSGWGQQTTLRGRVVRDYSGRDFEIRTDNGRSVTVRALRNEPIRLSEGDSVELRGEYERGLFLARTIDITRNDDQRKVDFKATVLQRVNSNRLEV
ncbi:hypothetical protein EON80_08620, partial [bacterium]